MNGAADQRTTAVAVVAADQISSSLSPAQRCASDTISVVMSFLTSGDFLAAIRACKDWHSAGLKPSA